MAGKEKEARLLAEGRALEGGGVGGTGGLWEQEEAEAGWRCLMASVVRMGMPLNTRRRPRSPCRCTWRCSSSSITRRLPAHVKLWGSQAVVVRGIRTERATVAGVAETAAAAVSRNENISRPSTMEGVVVVRMAEILACIETTICGTRGVRVAQKGVAAAAEAVSAAEGFRCPSSGGITRKETARRRMTGWGPGCPPL